MSRCPSCPGRGPVPSKGWTSWTHVPQHRAGRLSPFSSACCCCSVVSALCNPMDCSTPGFPVLHQLLELAQTHMSIESVMPSNHLVLCLPLLLLPSIFPSIRVFSNELACECEGGAQASLSPTATKRQSGVGSESGVGQEKEVDGGRLLTPPEQPASCSRGSAAVTPPQLIPIPQLPRLLPSPVSPSPTCSAQVPPSASHLTSLAGPTSAPGREWPAELEGGGVPGGRQTRKGRRGKMSSETSSGLGAWGVLAPNPWLSFHRLAVIKPILQQTA